MQFWLQMCITNYFDYNFHIVHGLDSEQKPRILHNQIDPAKNHGKSFPRQLSCTQLHVPLWMQNSTALKPSVYFHPEPKLQVLITFSKRVLHNENRCTKSEPNMALFNCCLILISRLASVSLFTFQIILPHEIKFARLLHLYLSSSLFISSGLTQLSTQTAALNFCQEHGRT